MPRRPRYAEPETIAPNGLIASAARLDLTKKPTGVIQQKWQQEAWQFYDECGELRYGANWFGNSLSRASIYAADVGEDGKPSGQPTENPTALAAAYDLLGGPTTQAQILQQVGIHLTIAGDCYVIGETPVDAEGNELPDDDWYVASTDELSWAQGTGWTIDRGNGKRPLDPDRTIIIRVWQSHPRKRWQADSPTRAVLPVLRELAALVRVAGQQMDSRLAGAGLLILPQGVTFPPPSQEALDANPDADPLMLSLAESILVPLDNPDDSARLVPPVLRMPAEAVDKVRHISFASQLQAENAAMREACIKRLALGLDMPPEVLLGMAGTNHWSAWAIEEQAVKLHLAPKLTTIVEAINEGYYVPALERLSLDPWRFTLWFDVSELTQRPNRGEAAQSLFDKGELSGDSMRRENGYGDSDAPTVEERAVRLLEAAANADPAAAKDYLRALVHLWGGGLVTALPDLPAITVPSERVDGGPPPADSTPPPAVEDNPGTPATDPTAALAPPRPPLSPAQEAIVQAANDVRAAAPELASTEIITAHLLTQRALELAGKRMLTRERRGQYGDTDVKTLHQHLPVASADLPRLLAGAFDWVDDLAGMVHLDAARFRAELTEYVGGLLTTGTGHDVRYLAAVVRKARRGAA